LHRKVRGLRGRSGQHGGFDSPRFDLRTAQLVASRYTDYAIPPPQGLFDIKALTLQAWADPEGSRRLRLPDFKTVGT